MHEWALAEAVVSTALKTSKKEGLKKITHLRIKIGELQQIDTEIFKFALKEVLLPQNPIIKGVRIELEKEECILKCKVCGTKWSFSEAVKRISAGECESIHFIPEVAHVYIRCPGCKSPDFEIAEGRGVWIDSIEGEKSNQKSNIKNQNDK